MKKNYVNTCSCCGVRFMNVPLIQKVPVHLEDSYVDLIRNDVAELDLKNRFYLSHKKGWINNFYYEFADAKEEVYAEPLMRSVNSLSVQIYDSYVAGQHMLYEEESAI